jgi:hypothetical protein
MTLQECMDAGGDLLSDAAERLCRVIRAALAMPRL